MKIRLHFLVSAVATVAMLSGCASVGRPLAGDPNPPAYKPKNPDNVRVKVSLKTQNVYVMEGDRLLLAAATCVGTPEKPTPRGDFRVYSKIETKRSNSYGFWANGSDVRPGTSGKSPGSGYRYVGYPMAYWTEFAPAYGFHQGYVWPFPKTHGCLRLHKNVAAKFFALVKTGTPVNIASTQPEDATIGRSVGRPNDYRDPDPPAPHMISTAVFSKPAGPLLIEQ